MIAKRVARTSGDSFGRLALYIAAASDKGEKLDNLWLVGCDAGTEDEDPIADPELIDLAIIEIEATQGLNQRSHSDKTYHLILSFRNEKPEHAALKEIEKRFAVALGFEDHQRVVATHVNTDNFHMHVAFNKIHPNTLNNVTPFQDFRSLEVTCRAVERDYGLKVDLGREDADEPCLASSAARDFEAHTWEQSFDSYVREQLEELETARDAAKSWDDLHSAFGEFGLGLKLRGNGLVIYDTSKRASKTRLIKASSLGRQFSKASLEGKLGAFATMATSAGGEDQPKAKNAKNAENAKTYSRRPITKHKDQRQLWEDFLLQAGSVKKLQRGDRLSARIFRTWREFLKAEALSDPLAMAIIMMQNKLFETIVPSNRSGPRRTFEVKRPKKLPEIAKEDRIYLNVSFSDRKEIKLAGARWDRTLKQWYVGKDCDAELLASWRKSGVLKLEVDDVRKNIPQRKDV